MSLTLPKFRILQRVKRAHVGEKEANGNGNKQRTYLALLAAEWVRWNVFGYLELTPEGEKQHAAGKVKFDRAALRCT